MLMGGIVFPIMTRSWQYPLVLTSGNWLALFGIIIIGTVFAYTFFLKRDDDYWGCEREPACSGRTSLISLFLGNHYA